ncbi:hypothetical protein [Flammeovirga kamogawensis]|uniref:Porin family protein n=1 Tax=Flammeovirga kamogawensis TaxID=373891 RepID=A0ABX8H0E3_9BACT|nr:hypothetical protein [Flammeovirga kamogawensis]MBB6459523.1 hypothetical protein [Flammeovirga kamogawensis]QWG09074.1 hypothetical protein KM029_09050 [Flammeovirga kamogawensis]TRX67362.1 hypothetical protein EO216_04090 [Flammeovirga kamogawensis]
MYKSLLIFSLLLFFIQTISAQEKKEPKHFISITNANTYIPKGAGVDNLDHKGHFVPGFGIDYLYRFLPKWEVGIMADFEVGEYIIPHDEPLKRENALVLALVATYTLIPNWNVFMGGGVELEKDHNLGIFRLGTEYAFPIGQQGWAIPLGVFYDIKEGYDAWSISVGVGKAF